MNLAGALMALWMLTVAALPTDEDHRHGHGKAVYFSSAFEGFLVLLAALSIAYTAVAQPLEAVGIGLAVSMVVSVINFATARVLIPDSTRRRLGECLPRPTRGHLPQSGSHQPKNLSSIRR